MIPHQKLPQVIIDPTTKSDEHDEAITAEQIVEQGLMTQKQWDFCSKKAIELFNFVSAKSLERGLILVDTKMEMGITPEGDIILIDEIFTPDSSRYWLLEGATEALARGECPQNIDKEFLRKKIKAQMKNTETDPIPEVSIPDIVETSRRYILLYEIIMGQQFPIADLTAKQDIQVAVQGALHAMYNRSPLPLAFAAPPKSLLLAEMAAPAPAPATKPEPKTKNARDKYASPLSGRYVSDDMSAIFSEDNKFRMWRVMWATIARLMMEFGVGKITEEQVLELEAAIDAPIDYKKAAEHEAKLKHDVMAHVHTLAEICHKAKPIIHLALTSCDITDNAEQKQLLDAMNLLLQKTMAVLQDLRDFAFKHKDVITLGSTHGQAAQLTTVGKRAMMWAEALQICIKNLEFQRDTIEFRGIKGATGTQATIATLFKNDAAKIAEFEQELCLLLGFKQCLSATGQTAHRVSDHFIVATTVGINATLAKMANDIRLLCHDLEFGEPRGKDQIGSSAMPFKENPMMDERACSLARNAMALGAVPAQTHAVQWLERSLDDSAGRRSVIPETFLGADANLKIMAAVIPGLRVHEDVIALHVEEKLPFMVVEQVMLEAVVEHGGDRQDMHEIIRQLASQAMDNVRKRQPNNFIELICADVRIPLPIRDALKVKSLAPKDYVGLAVQQTEAKCAEIDEFLASRHFDKSQIMRVALAV